MLVGACLQAAEGGGWFPLPPPLNWVLGVTQGAAGAPPRRRGGGGGVAAGGLHTPGVCPAAAAQADGGAGEGAATPPRIPPGKFPGNPPGKPPRPPAPLLRRLGPGPQPPQGAPRYGVGDDTREGPLRGSLVQGGGTWGVSQPPQGGPWYGGGDTGWVTAPPRGSLVGVGGTWWGPANGEGGCAADPHPPHPNMSSSPPPGTRLSKVYSQSTLSLSSVANEAGVGPPRAPR